MPAPDLDDLGLAVDCGREVIGDLADDPGSRFLIELSSKTTCKPTGSQENDTSTPATFIR